jgi:hypothetical protein
MLSKLIVRTFLLVGLAINFSASKSGAAEYAFTTYPLGNLAFGAGITPPPGFYLTDAVSFYTGSIGGNFDFGGRAFSAGVKADIDLNQTNFLYVPNIKVLEGYLGVSLTVPAGYVDYTASGTGPRGNTVSDETRGTGLGDFVYQAQLGWDKGDFSNSFYFLIVAPTGRYQTGFYPIVGLNRPSFDLGWAFTYYDKSSKLQFNAAFGFMTSLENYTTRYQTGDEVHVEWAIGYKFDNGLIFGVVGYDYRQVTGDSGPGAILGPFESSADAIGPGLSYSTKIGETPVTINVRDYEQYTTKHLFGGNAAIASFTAAFPAAEPLK